MATPNQTNPSGGPQTIDPKQFAAGLKTLLEDQGDYNNLLKDAIKELGQMDRAYNKIEARLATLNSDSINVKQVNRDLLLLKQKEYIENKKLSDLEKLISAESIRNLDLVKNQVKKEEERAKKKGDIFDIEKAMFDNLESIGDLEAAALYAQEKKLEIAGKQVEAGKAMLNNEKAVNTQLGISGNLVKVFATKLGFGEEAYSAMSLKARKLTEEQKNLNGLSYGFSKVLGFWKVAGAGAGSVIKSAFSRDITKCIEFQKPHFISPSEIVNLPYLTEEEIEKISNLVILDDIDRNIRDIFVLQCYAGFRIEDLLKQLKQPSIIEQSGRKFFYTKQGKTGGEIWVPINEKIRKLISNNNGKLPYYVHQNEINERIKSICKRAKIDNDYSVERTYNNKTVVETKPKYKYIATHTARRSFCTNAYMANVPVHHIMSISGHKTEKIFLNYVKVEKKLEAVIIAENKFFQ